MKINSIMLSNFRNYKKSTFYFANNLNILIGNNAQGKTNLIEAISLLSIGRSFKTHFNNQMIKFNEDFAKIKASIISVKKEHDLEIIISKDFKKARFDNKEINKISDYVGFLNAIIFTPDDLNLVKGNPKNRRRFLDIELSKISPIYMYNLNKYQYLLQERNKYLKLLNEKRLEADDYLLVIDEQLANLQVDLIKKRIDFISKLNQYLNHFYSYIAGKEEYLEIKYDCFLKNKEIISQEILNIIKKNNYRDIRYMNTNVGIHKDDLIIKINNNDAQDYASQGQQRTIVLAMKISLLYLINQEIGEYPVLLLDDVLSELDDKRKTLLLKLLNNKIQTFITTTSLKGINQKFIDEANIIYIKGEN